MLLHISKSAYIQRAGGWQRHEDARLLGHTGKNFIDVLLMPRCSARPPLLQVDGNGMKTPGWRDYYWKLI
jgi:hypothetical protein